MASEGKIRETFTVRKAASLDDLQWVMEMASEEGWGQHEKEAECFFSAGIASYFFIGELNGKRISCVSVIRYGESVAFVGYYIVAKPHRGHGYGMKTWEMAFAGIGDQCNGQLVAAANSSMKDKYQQKMGFQPRWAIRRYGFTASRSLEGLKSTQVPPSVAQILPASQADFEKVFVYGADMLGTSQSCKSILAGWLSYTQESSWVAIGNKGEVVGYLIMTQAMLDTETAGCRIAPFIADSVAIARSLLKVAVSSTSAIALGNIYLDIAAELNPEAVNVLESEIGAQPMFEFVFMSTKETNKLHRKMFALPSIQIM